MSTIMARNGGKIFSLPIPGSAVKMVDRQEILIEGEEETEDSNRGAGITQAP
jgi:hypothetical protein